MPRTPTAKIRVGDIVECGFVFRNKSKLLTTPTAVTVEITDEAGNIETITQSDSRVTLGTTLGVDLAAALGLSTAENTAGVGIISVEVTPDIDGQWTVYCAGTATVTGAAASTFKVYAKTE